MLFYYLSFNDLYNHYLLTQPTVTYSVFERPHRNLQLTLASQNYFLISLAGL